MDSFIQFIGNQKKFEVLKILNKGESEVMELVRKIGSISQPKVSLILKELRDLNLVTVRVVGKKRIYKINKIKLSEYVEVIKKYVVELDCGLVDEIIIRR